MQGPSPQPETRIVIHGVGLIGGSIAAAARQRIPGCRIIGIGRSRTRLQAAQAAGLLDEWSTRFETAHAGESGLVVICLPVDKIADAVLETAAVAADQVLITDAGSVKMCICERVAGDAAAARLFVGSHPIAGSERGGFEHAEAELFAGRPCIVTDTVAAADRIDRTVRFWSALGCQVTRMSAARHDRILARTSHLPHVLAAVAAACVDQDQLPFTGTGFRDTTRVAMGSSSLWSRILSCNRTEMLAALQQSEQQLRQLRAALETHDTESLEAILEAAAQRRHQLDAGS